MTALSHQWYKKVLIFKENSGVGEDKKLTIKAY